MDIKFTLNEVDVTLRTSPTRRLLDVLREDFQCFSIKEGCGEGECGACSVLLDGKLVNACLIAIATIANHRIMTLEGYRTTERFEAIKKGFAIAGSVQCGFCTPGMVLAAEALLCENPQPSASEIRSAIEGNLCRCTGYTMIVDGILTAAKEGAGLW
ncbi:MAG: (2Fe-2S)-binding protein [Erysipelotrichales bacterium]|nr:MAG: (2Fe-2S)-binding protein [Erysipelotrichales bacterium]